MMISRSSYHSPPERPSSPYPVISRTRVRMISSRSSLRPVWIGRITDSRFAKVNVGLTINTTLSHGSIFFVVRASSCWNSKSLATPMMSPTVRYLIQAPNALSRSLITLSSFLCCRVRRERPTRIARAQQIPVAHTTRPMVSSNE